MTVGSQCKIATMGVSAVNQKNTKEMNAVGLNRYMKLTEVTDEFKCCCSCRHNIRTICHCEKDGHHIGYVANFEQVCEEWEEEE